MKNYAILDGHRVVPTNDSMTWAKWMERNKYKRNKYKPRAESGRKYSTPEEDPTRVAHDQIGEADVSTVFLGLNHSFGVGPDLWFETMVFGGPLDGEQERYETWDEAVAGHAAMVARVKQANN